MTDLERRKQLEQLRRVDPAGYADLAAVVSEIERREEKHRYETSFLEFIKRAWHEVDPAPLSINWHHEVIIEHLESVCRGELRHLIISQPPRTSKTLLVSILYPAWVWCRSEIGPQSGPQVKFFCVSYSATLAEEIAVKMRRLVSGHWYQSLWGNRVKLLADQSSRSNFANTAGGERISNSLEAGLIGKGGICHLYDDLISIAGAESDAERQSTLRAFSESLPTRITEPRFAAKILIGQRTHEDDPHNLALETWPPETVHLMFPARFEVDRACPQDRRTYEGELLWPEVWPEEELRKVELGLRGLEKGQAGLSSYAAQAQLQQAPVPRGGGIIARTDWRVWPEEAPQLGDMQRGPNGELLVRLPALSFVLMALDTAFSERDTADWNACVVLGVWHRRREQVARDTGWYAGRWGGASDPDSELARIQDEDEQPRVVLMEAWQTRAKLNDPTLGPGGKAVGLVQRLIDTARRRRADRILIENKTRGKDTADELRRQLGRQEFLIEMFEPNQHGDKVARMHSVQPLFAQGLVYAPANLVQGANGQVEVAEFRWVNSIVEQCQRCPRGKQDLADATSSGLIWLRKNGFLQLTSEFVQDELARRVFRPRRAPVGKQYGVV